MLPPEVAVCVHYVSPRTAIKVPRPLTCASNEAVKAEGPSTAVLERDPCFHVVISYQPPNISGRTQSNARRTTDQQERRASPQP